MTAKESNIAPKNVVQQDEEIEEVENIDEKSGNKMLDGLESKDNDDQKSHFNINTGTEEATNMES